MISFLAAAWSFLEPFLTHLPASPLPQPCHAPLQYYLWLRGWEEPESRILGKDLPHHLLSILFSATQIEDGGKAALSQKMRTGDELVNINGTPLYGSRQEALILIKGSFRILKLIVRR